MGEREKGGEGGRAHATSQKHNHKHQIDASAFGGTFHLLSFSKSTFKIIENRMFG